MVSRDQADKAAESLLQPSKEELSARQQRVARRKADNTKFYKLVVPAVAAIGALVLVDYLNSIVLTAIVATAIGWTVGSILDRSR